MNKIPNLTALPLALLLLTACDKSEGVEDIDTPDVPVVPDAPHDEEEPMPLSVLARAVDNASLEGVDVGLFMQPYQAGMMADLLPAYNYINNVKMTCHDRAWHTATPVYWYDATTLADLYAYAPYMKDVGDCRKMAFACPTDQTSDAALKQADLLWGRNMALDPSLDDINVSLDHRLARVNVRVIAEEDFDADELKAADVKVWIGSMRCEALMDVQTGELTVGGDGRSIAMHNNGDLTYTAIVLPQTVGFANLIHVEWGDVAYTLQGTATFDPRRIYDLSVRINKIEASGLTVGISGWDIDDKDYGGTVE